MAEFKDRLEESRTAKKLSRRELARISGVHPNTLNRWASGETLNPQPDELKKVSEVLGVSYEWLRTGIEDLPPRASITLGVGGGKSAAPSSYIQLPGRASRGSAFQQLETISGGADLLVLGQALQAILKALPPRGINLEEPRLAQLLEDVVRRAVESGSKPDEKMVLEELTKPI